MKNLIKSLLLIMVVAFTALTFTGCQKDKQPDKTKPITVQCEVQGLKVQNLKSFDLSQWTYNYNPNSYEITFTGTQNNVYTYNLSIAQLSNSFEIQVIPDSYQVSYCSEHIGESIDNPLSTTLDIKINEVVNIANNQPVLLTAHNDDELFILDLLNLKDGMIENNSIWNMMFSYPNHSFKYAYLNKENEDVNFRYFINNYETATIEEYFKTITNVQKNKIYHIQSAINGTTNINILPFDSELIGW